MKHIILPFLFLTTYWSTAFAQDNTWAATWQKVDVSAYEGMTFKLEAAVKVETDDKAARAQLWARIDKKDGSRGFFDNMNDRQITDTEWKVYTIEGKIDEGANELYFGGMTYYNGTFYFDDFKISMNKDGNWEQLEIKNPSFEETEIEKGMLKDWGGNIINRLDFKPSSTDDAYSGKFALKVVSTDIFNAPAAMKKYVGKWDVVHLPDSATNDSHTETGVWVFEEIENSGGLALKTEYNAKMMGKDYEEKDFIVYAPNTEKAYFTMLAYDNAYVYEGALQKDANLIFKSTLKGYSEEYTFEWLTENELIFIYKRIYEEEDDSRNIKYYYQMTRK
ncbi:MAG: hypothetical protein AAF806_17755 [Bacteroidota bacterium]